MLRADSALGRIVQAARPGPPLVKLTVSPRLARVLTAAGARSAMTNDSMTVYFAPTPETEHATAQPSGTSVSQHHGALGKRQHPRPGSSRQLASAVIAARSTMRL